MKNKSFYLERLVKTHMKQILTLTRMQLGSALDFIKIFGGKNKDKKKNASALVIIAGAGILFAALSAIYSYALAIGLKESGELRVLPGLMMAVVCLVTLITTIYKVKGTLFGFKDYDIVMSFPVQTSKVAASRLLLLYIINVFFIIVLLVPSYIIYGVMAKASVAFYILSLISIIFVPLVPMIIASIIGTVIAAIASKFRHSNIVNLMLMVILLCAVMVFSFSIQSADQLNQMSSALNDQVQKIYPLSEMYLKGIIDFDMVAYLGFLIISVAVFIIFAVIVGMSFKKLNTSITTIRTKSNYKFKKQEQSSPFIALYKKELKRLTSSVIYMMNSCFGIVLMTLGTIALIFMKPEALMEILEITGTSSMFGDYLPFFFIFLVGTVNISACSISLEGKNLWILKSAPISIAMIFRSKIALNLTVVVPFLLLDTIILGIVLNLTPVQWIAAFMLPIIFNYMLAVLGIIINLKFPLLNWTNETVVVKQSASSMISGFSGLFIGALPLIAFFIFQNASVELIFVCSGAIALLVGFVLWRYLEQKGSKIFQNLI